MSIERSVVDWFDSADSPKRNMAAARRWNTRSRLVSTGVVLFLLHAFCMLYRYGQRPPVPVIGDEVTINDPAVALSRGLGLVAPSFKDSVFGFDKLYAHFPPVYIYAQSVVFRVMGISVYSLRFTATVADLLAVLAFLVFLYWLWRRGLADAGTAAIAAMLYTLNASVVALHRIARMEPLVELLAILALWCCIAALKSGNGGTTRRSTGLQVLACICAGVSMATHPEALTAVLPMLVILWIERGATWSRRSLSAGVFAITPTLIWIGVYRSQSVNALKQMWRMGRFAPGPGVYSFAHTFTREDHRNIGQGMRASLFILCLTSLVVVTMRWWALERAVRLGPREGEQDTVRLFTARAFALATGISLVLLIWFIGASVARYEVIYPVWLLGLVLVLRGIHLGRARRVVVGLMAAVVVAEVIALCWYLWRPDVSPVDADSHRFDSIIAQIPRKDTVAATPMLWLAFEQQNRPFTLLFWRFDGREKWRGENGGNPLKQFDAVVVDESFIGDYMLDSPYAAEGRTERSYVVGSDVVHLFLPRKASH